jgi:hypothetical protein
MGTKGGLFSTGIYWFPQAWRSYPLVIHWIWGFGEKFAAYSQERLQMVDCQMQQMRIFAETQLVNCTHGKNYFSG